jgi:hypothetical protein
VSYEKQKGGQAEKDMFSEKGLRLQGNGEMGFTAISYATNGNEFKLRHG